MLHVESRCGYCPLSTLLTSIAYESSYLGDFKQAFYKLPPFILFHQYGRLFLNRVVIIKKGAFCHLFWVILSSKIKAVDYCRHDIGLKPSLVICNVPVLRRFVYRLHRLRRSTYFSRLTNLRDSFNHRPDHEVEWSWVWPLSYSSSIKY